MVKASGHGIANQLCRFSVETNPAMPPAVLEYDGDPEPDWSLALLEPEQGFLGAVAAPVGGLRIKALKLLPATGRADE